MFTIKLDKILHFSAGFFIYIVLSLIGAYYGLALSPVFKMLIVSLAGIVKEIYDRFTDGIVDIADVITTILGGLLAAIGWFLLVNEHYALLFSFWD